MNICRLLLSLVLLMCWIPTNGQVQEATSLSKKSRQRIQQKEALIDSLKAVGSSEREIARLHTDIAWICLNSLGGFKEAERNNNLADSLAHLLRDTSLMAETQTIKGRLYLRQGFLNASLETQKKAYELKAALRDTGRMAYSVNLMGKVYLTQKKYKEALDFYMRGMKLKEAVGHEKTAFLVFRSIALCYLNLGDINKAREYAEKAMALAKEGSRKSARAYFAFAEIEFAEANYSLALQHCQKAEKYMLEKGVNIDIAVVQVLLSKILYNLDRFSEAEVKAQSAYELARIQDHPLVMIDALTILENIAMQKMAHEEAHLISLNIRSLRDSFYKQEDITRTLDFEILYRVQEREKQIAELEAETKENLREIALKEKQRGILLAVLIASSLLLSALIWFLYYKNRRDKELSEKDLTIERQKIKEMKQEQKAIQLQSMIKGQEKERLRLSQDIHDSLGGLLSTAKTYLSEKNDSDVHIKNIIDQSCVEVRDITNNLMPVSLKVVGLSGAIEDLSARTEMLGINCQTEIHNLDVKDEDERLAIYRIVQELVNNVIKHASAKNLLIQLIQSDHGLHILIEDDGQGFQTTVESNGRGLKNIKSRVELLKGEIEIESDEGSGTSISINVPLRSKSISG